MTTLQPTRSWSGPTARRAGLGLYLVAVTAVVVSTPAPGAGTGTSAAIVAVACIARGLHLHRPVTSVHTATALACLLAARLVDDLGGAPRAAFALTVVSGWVLVRATGSVPHPEQHPRIEALVQRSVGDPLAPFALNSSKSYFVNAAGTAAIAYRTRAGIAVVSGDPVGDPGAFADLLGRFTNYATGRGWRVAVLAASEDLTRLWQTPAPGRGPWRAVCIGRDVVVDVDHFTLAGRRFRNLRQAVQRSHNAGVHTEIVAERDLSPTLRRQLLAIVAGTRAGHQRRGFSMILDHLLDGTRPDTMIVVARDRSGRPVGFQRYGTAQHGNEWSLDVPWRSLHAPNGTDERMIVDVLDHVRRRGGTSVSLAFAPFPALFAPADAARWQPAARAALRLAHSVVALESLYRYLDKFHAAAGRRFVLFRLRCLLPTLVAVLTFEFVAHREHGPAAPPRPRPAGS